jgi:hypothetical protein
MVFKIKKKVEIPDGFIEYQFSVLSEHDGIRITLTDWKQKLKAAKLKRWSRIGDDGSFVRRESIVVPQEVLEEVKTEIAESIHFEHQEEV